MIVVSDTSTITGLLVLDKIKLLKQLFGQVLIPSAVYQELNFLSNYGYETEN